MNEKKEYIERGALIDSFENCYYLYSSTDRETVRQAIENAPGAALGGDCSTLFDMIGGKK